MEKLNYIALDGYQIIHACTQKKLRVEMGASLTHKTTMQNKQLKLTSKNSMNNEGARPRISEREATTHYSSYMEKPENTRALSTSIQQMDVHAISLTSKWWRIYAN